MAAETSTSTPKVIEIEFHWTIPHFLLYRDLFVSPVFYAKSYENLPWRLTVDPFFRGSEGEKVVAVHLIDMSMHTNAYHTLELSIAPSGNAGGTPIKAVSLWGTAWKIRNNTNCLTNKLVSRSYLVANEADYLTDGELTLICKLRVRPHRKGDDTSRILEIKVPEKQLVNDFERLLESGIDSDVIIRTGNMKFHAHKVILIARSSVFADIFETSARRTNHVVLTDLPCEAIREMLRFIYTGKHPEVENVTSDLLVASYRYNLERLKSMCERVLSGRINFHNAVALHDVAEKHNAKHLQMRALQFVEENRKDVGLEYMSKQQNSSLSEIFELRVVIE